MSDQMPEGSPFAVDLEIAIAAAREAGARVAEHACDGVKRLTKTHEATTDEAVTIADREAQAIVVATLRKHFPTDGIIGEESEDGSAITADINDPAGRNWVIDPIDGTNNFIAGLGNYAVCIGLLVDGEPVVGVVFDVSRDRLYAGAKGSAVMVNGEPIDLCCEDVSKASVLMMTSNLLDRHGKAPGWATTFLSQTDLKVRILGTAALEATMVAAGTAQAAITVNGKLWDAVAPCALVLANGGRVTDFVGNDVFPYDVTDYRGAKVPFLAATTQALPVILEHMRRNP
ncbi:MAG: inositol monophosphatase family protein [Planctomycetota bacterium]